MLQDDVSHVEHLKQVEETVQKLKVTLSQDLKYDGYDKLLKETAINHEPRMRV